MSSTQHVVLAAHWSRFTVSFNTTNTDDYKCGKIASLNCRYKVVTNCKTLRVYMRFHCTGGQTGTVHSVHSVYKIDYATYQIPTHNNVIIKLFQLQLQNIHKEGRISVAPSEWREPAL